MPNGLKFIWLKNFYVLININSIFRDLEHCWNFSRRAAQTKIRSVKTSKQRMNDIVVTTKIEGKFGCLRCDFIFPKYYKKFLFLFQTLCRKIY